jgi:hypothetical protein
MHAHTERREKESAKLNDPDHRDSRAAHEFFRFRQPNGSALSCEHR